MSAACALRTWSCGQLHAGEMQRQLITSDKPRILRAITLVPRAEKRAAFRDPAVALDAMAAVKPGARTSSSRD